MSQKLMMALFSLFALVSLGMGRAAVAEVESAEAAYDAAPVDRFVEHSRFVLRFPGAASVVTLTVPMKKDTDIRKVRVDVTPSKAATVTNVTVDGELLDGPDASGRVFTTSDNQARTAREEIKITFEKHPTLFKKNAMVTIYTTK